MHSWDSKLHWMNFNEVYCAATICKLNKYLSDAVLYVCSSWFMLLRIASWSSYHNLYRCRWRGVEKPILRSVFFLAPSPAIVWMAINYYYFAMVLNEVQGLLLPGVYVLVYLVRCQVISLQPTSAGGSWTPHSAECGVSSSRKGHEDNHARVQTVQAGRGPGGGTRRRGWNVAGRPRYGISYMILTKAFDIEENLWYPYIQTLHRYHGRHQNFPLRCPFIQILHYDIVPDIEEKLVKLMICTSKVMSGLFRVRILPEGFSA